MSEILLSSMCTDGCVRCKLSKIDFKNSLTHEFSFKKMQRVLHFNEFFCIFSVFHLSSTERPATSKNIFFLKLISMNKASLFFVKLCLFSSLLGISFLT